jgi:hypothetical protein
MVALLVKKFPSFMVHEDSLPFHNNISLVPEPDESRWSLSLCSSHNVKHQISQPLKSEGTILHISKYETIRLGWRTWWAIIIHYLTIYSIF